MSDHDSASESDTRKQPLLNQEEKVSKAAATKARMKAPVMSIRLLKDRKVRKPSKPPIKIGQKWTERSVVDTLRKKELLEKIQDETGAKPGTKEMINHYTKQLNQLIASLSPDELQEAKETAELWNCQGVPDDVKADIARQKSDDMIHHFVTEMWNRAGMRVFIVSAWKNEEGKIHDAGHDYNNEYGSADSFMKTHNWDIILPEWDFYAESAFDGNLDGDAVVTRKKGRQDKTYILQLGNDGYPVLPACDSVDLDMKKAVIRAFLTWHYRKCCGDPKISVPWKYVIPRYTEIIPAECLPEGHSLAEPSKLKQVHAAQLLQFWYNRQEEGEARVLEFIGWWDNDKEDMVLAADIDVPVTKPTETTRQPKQRSQSRNRNREQPEPQRSTKGRSASRLDTKKMQSSKTTQRKGASLPHCPQKGKGHESSADEVNDQPITTAESVDRLDDSEDEIPSQQKANKSKGKRRRQVSMSSSNNTSSDDEQPGKLVSTGKRTKKDVPASPSMPATVNIQPNKMRRVVERPQNAVRKHGGKGVEHEPSATCAELTASAPRVQVEWPAQEVNTADITRAKTRVHKRTAEESLERSPAKRTRRQVAIEQAKGIVRQVGKMAGKKQVTEQATDGSPLKWTRSKTSQTGAGKCSRKPNSRYNDYVKP
ncbi:uncharacterized protein HD556DRAFT_1436357 [Suillus plorans]|uniref:Uncharacterized protein n=1 Tax=Suillus plorans TaxID=116603 RepID=A0A9P7J7C7_9AGAM|nr:uncharacterized protein HD556DRAFT_1436357 [Suillus plorans]KAG1806392.1 hypothetical protein HD556DRAFT_1436357 [Suillus plorans]